jgi:hypothetical protein
MLARRATRTMRPVTPAVRPLAVGGHEDRAQPAVWQMVRVTRPGGARFQGHGHELAALAEYVQAAVAPLEAKSLNVGPEGLRQPQPVPRRERDSPVTLGIGPVQRSWQRASGRLALVPKPLK